MNEAKLQKQKDKLVKNKFMDENDNLLDYVQGNTRERLLGKWGSWKQGWIYFTEQKIICFWGIAGHLEIPYNSISALGKCTQMFLPFGITITHTDKDGNVVEDKISVQKRDERIKLISERSGVAVS
ncbi:MAG: hypothetical protein ACI4DN_02835 [Lachnospiraceae bacterium]